MIIAIDMIGTNLGSGTKTYNLNFCENIIKTNRKTNFSEWLDFRKENIIKNNSKLSVSNKDFLAIKI